MVTRIEVFDSKGNPVDIETGESDDEEIEDSGGE
jgi:hypothetical protein